MSSICWWQGWVYWEDAGECGGVRRQGCIGRRAEDGDWYYLHCSGVILASVQICPTKLRYKNTACTWDPSEEYLASIQSTLCSLFLIHHKHFPHDICLLFVCFEKTLIAHHWINFCLNKQYTKQRFMLWKSLKLLISSLQGVETLVLCLFKTFISHLFLNFEHSCFPKYFWCQLWNFSPQNLSSWPWNATLFCENECASKGPGASCTFYKSVQVLINESLWDGICIWYAL